MDSRTVLISVSLLAISVFLANQYRTHKQKSTFEVHKIKIRNRQKNTKVMSKYPYCINMELFL